MNFLYLLLKSWPPLETTEITPKCRGGSRICKKGAEIQRGGGGGRVADITRK